MFKYLVSPVLILIFLHGCMNEREQVLIGAKIYEHEGSHRDLFRQWKQLGINTAFCSEELVSDPEFIKQARKHRVTAFVIFPVFQNPEAIARRPELAAIMQNGHPAREEWVEFVCPSREGYRQQVLAHARQLVRDHQPDGISIDFIRHFVYWEKVYPDRDPSTLPLSCFDPVCLEEFWAESGIKVPEGLAGIQEQARWILDHHAEAWSRWRCHLISSMVEEISEVVREEKADILVNVHLVPWAEKDFDGAIKRVAGQDIPSLSVHCDYLSPMTYAHMLKRPPGWVHDIVKDLNRQSGASVLPSIQVGKAYLENEFDTEEFRQTMEAALQAPSSGVILWSWERLVAEPEKVKLFKDIVHAR